MNGPVPGTGSGEAVIAASRTEVLGSDPRQAGRFTAVEDPDRAFIIEPPLQGWKLRAPEEVPPISPVKFNGEKVVFADIAKFLIEERGIAPEAAGLVIRVAMAGGWASEEFKKIRIDGLPEGLLAEGLIVRLSAITPDDCPSFYFGMEVERSDYIRAVFRDHMEPSGQPSRFSSEHWDAVREGRESGERSPRGWDALREIDDPGQLTNMEQRILQDTRAELHSRVGARMICSREGMHWFRGGEYWRQYRAGIPPCGSDNDYEYE